MSEITELLARFGQAPGLIAEAMSGIGPAELDYAPDRGQWSIRKLVAHVSDTELVASFRLRIVVAQDNPPLQPFDQEAWERNLNYSSRDPERALATFRQVRSDNHDLLQSLPEAAFDRVGQHAERGPLTLLNLLRINTEHAESHLRQIRTRREQFKQSREEER